MRETIQQLGLDKVQMMDGWIVFFLLSKDLSNFFAVVVFPSDPFSFPIAAPVHSKRTDAPDDRNAHRSNAKKKKKNSEKKRGKGKGSGLGGGYEIEKEETENRATPGG
ncbi:hypothetical protein M413DRAFT_340720 [Hebeloma cylindrosporum]|uniref:Uncharacterized protein n=1 Tax=Hebeloma cylindrosporum TaxID=76867 RepID=A0A0C3C9C0_HEBCY|nr:hypothetical protein M413DRAFT_340720 [Hebeloma cylindrosporum h7]